MNSNDPWEEDGFGALDPNGLVLIPGFHSGGRVERTGIALVHEGEHIIPAPGSEALIGTVDGATAGYPVVHYHFPVEVEIIGDLSESHMRGVADQIYRELNEALSSRR